MINSNYSKAYSEVLEIISALSRIEYNKIPIKYIEYLEENADRSEGFKYNIGLPFDKQNVLKIMSDLIYEEIGTRHDLSKLDFPTRLYSKVYDSLMIKESEYCDNIAKVYFE